jgi:hypothetical protein
LKLNLTNVKNKYILLFILGIFNYIYVNSFLLAFIEIDIKKALIATLLGDVVWYTLVMSSTLSGINILRDIQTLSVAILLTIVFAIVGDSYLRRRKSAHR